MIVAIPVPTDWPEQSVRLVDEDITRNVRFTTYDVLDDGVKRMILNIPQVSPGEEVRGLVTLEVTTRKILAPEDTTIFEIDKRPPRELRRYLGTSPFIDSRHSSIRRKAKEFEDDDATAWEHVEKIYDWVRENINQDNEEMKGAVQAMRDGSGHAEDLVNVFVALCRASDVPARFVWVQGHYYAEFYLVDDEGQGHWFPCQLAGNREFGSMSDTRPILQKGDNIRVPEKDVPQRYVPEIVKGKRKRNSGVPQVKFVRELLPDQ